MGAREPGARPVAHRRHRAAARRLGAPGDGGDRGARQSAAGPRQEGGHPGAAAHEAVHPRPDRPGRGARRERPQIKAQIGHRAALVPAKPGRADGRAAGAHQHGEPLRGEPHLAGARRPARDQGHSRHPQGVGRLPRRHGAPAHPVPPRPRPGSAASRDGPPHGLRQDRRDHQADPLERGPGRGEIQASRQVSF